MARKSGSTIVQEELYPHGVERSRVEPSRVESARNNHDNDLDDARLVDLDVDEESPFLRGQKRVPARRSSIPKKTASRLLWASIAAAILCVIAIAAAALPGVDPVTMAFETLPLLLLYLASIVLLRWVEYRGRRRSLAEASRSANDSDDS